MNSPTPGQAEVTVRVSLARRLVALFVAPLAWFAQVLICEPIAALACYPKANPLPVPLWPTLPIVLVVISLLCVAVGLTGLYYSHKNWRTLRTETTNGHDIVEIGEGRREFIALIAALTSGVFVVGIVFTSVAALVVLPCQSWF